MDFRKSESGNVLVVTALCMTVLMGFAGMAVDVGMAYHTRQRVQTAADAGAIAAALSNFNGGSGTAAAYTAVQQNGYPGTSTDVTVTYPVSFNGINGFTQVTVVEPRLTSFMRVFGFNLLSVSATAVAGPALVGSGCMDLTGTTGTDFNFSGSNYLNLNCGIYVASSSNNAVNVQDCGGSNKTTYTYLEILGGISQHGGCNYPAVTGVQPNTNFWGNQTGPSIPGDCSPGHTFPLSGTAPITITGSNVSTYSDSATNGVVCFTSPVTLGGGAGDQVNFSGSPGGVVYVFENGVTIAGNSSVQFGMGGCTVSGSSATCTTSAGAVMEITCPPGTSGNCPSAFNTPGAASSLSIYAPTQQPGTPLWDSYLNGIAILQPAIDTNTLNLVFGSTGGGSGGSGVAGTGAGALTIDGYIYAPTASVYMQDQGSGVLATGMVVNSIAPGSNSSVTIYSYDQANSGTTLNKVVTLVE